MIFYSKIEYIRKKFNKSEIYLENTIFYFICLEQVNDHSIIEIKFKKSSILVEKLKKMMIYCNYIFIVTYLLEYYNVFKCKID